MKLMRTILAISMLLAFGCGDAKKKSDGAVRAVDVGHDRVSDELVGATVNGQVVSVAQVEAAAKRTGTDPSLRGALDAAIGEELLVQQAVEEGIGGDKAVAVVRNKTLALSYLTSIADNVTLKNIPQREVQTYYEAHRSDYVHPTLRKVVHVLFVTKDGALDETEARKQAVALRPALLLATSETDIRVAVFNNVEDSSHLKIESLQPFDKDADWLVPSFVKGAFAVDYPNERVSAPVKTDYGWHLIWIEEQKNARNDTVVQADGEIREILLPDLKKKAVQQEISRLMDKVDLRIYEDRLALVSKGVQ